MMSGATQAAAALSCWQLWQVASGDLCVNVLAENENAAVIVALRFHVVGTRLRLSPFLSVGRVRPGIRRLTGKLWYSRHTAVELAGIVAG